MTTAVKKQKYSRIPEFIFQGLTFLFAITPIIIGILLAHQLTKGAWLAISTFGLRFFTSSDWNPVANQFGALPFLYGTLVSSLLALIIALPISIGTSVFLSELAPLWLRNVVKTTVELIAAIPSVILGLWGIFIMIPFLRSHVFPLLKNLFGSLPFFSGPIFGPCILAAGIMLAIMITPIITSVCTEIFMTTPQTQREAAYALGATKWETIRIAVLSPAKPGIAGAAILGLSRALGETMAVTMVIGNRPEIAISLFAPGHTLASAIANEFAEATTQIYLSALFELGLVLALVTLSTNIIARLITVQATRRFTTPNP